MFYGTGHCRERDDDPGRLVEFLNEQMRPAEVIAIEVDQFTSTNSLRTLVPRLVGQGRYQVACYLVVGLDLSGHWPYIVF